MGTLALDKISVQILKAFSPEIPLGVMVSPTNSLSSEAFLGLPKTGLLSVTLLIEYFIISNVISIKSISILCIQVFLYNL